MTDSKLSLTGIFENGYGIIPKKIMQDKDLNIYDKCILAYMLSFTGGGDTCFPSYKKISEDLCISEPTIAKSLKKLRSAGFIRVERLYPKENLKRNNKYILTFLREAPILNEVKHDAKAGEVPHETALCSNNNIVNNNTNKTTFHQIDGWFKKENENYYKDAKQATNIKRIITRVKEWQEIERLLNKFKLMRTAEDFWSNKPLTPAIFYSSLDNIIAWGEKRRRGSIADCIT